MLRDELILLLHERPPTGKRQRRKNCDARLKGPPEVPAISSAVVIELYCFEKAKALFGCIQKAASIRTLSVYTHD